MGEEGPSDTSFPSHVGLFSLSNAGFKTHIRVLSIAVGAEQALWNKGENSEPMDSNSVPLETAKEVEPRGAGG